MNAQFAPREVSASSVADAESRTPTRRFGGETYATEEEAVTKKQIVRLISDDLNLSQQDVKKVVQRTFDAVIQTLADEGRIELRNFGVFEVKERKARKARNPRTGDEVYVPPKRVVTFKPGKEMEQMVASSGPEGASADAGA